MSTLHARMPALVGVDHYKLEWMRRKRELTPISSRNTGSPSGGGHCPRTWASSSGLLPRVPCRRNLPQGARGLLLGPVSSFSPAKGFSDRRRCERCHRTRTDLLRVLWGNLQGGRAVSRWEASYINEPLLETMIEQPTPSISSFDSQSCHRFLEPSFLSFNAYLLGILHAQPPSSGSECTRSAANPFNLFVSPSRAPPFYCPPPVASSL